MAHTIGPSHNTSAILLALFEVALISSSCKAEYMESGTKPALRELFKARSKTLQGMYRQPR